MRDDLTVALRIDGERETLIARDLGLRQRQTCGYGQRHGRCLTDGDAST